MPETDPQWQSVLRAIQQYKEGNVPNEKCVYCGGVILVDGSPRGGPYVSFVFTCPCKKSEGFLKGI